MPGLAVPGICRILIIRRDTLEKVIAAQKPVLKSNKAGTGYEGRDQLTERDEVVRSMLGENHEKMTKSG